MAAPTHPLAGAALMAAITEAMVARHERYHHRKPVTAKTQMMGDDLLACVLGGVYTEVEQTLIELEQHAVVQEARSTFQIAMKDRFTAEIQRLTGRRVLTFISSHHVGPDLEVELFVLAPTK